MSFLASEIGSVWMIPARGSTSLSSSSEFKWTSSSSSSSAAAKFVRPFFLYRIVEDDVDGVVLFPLPWRRRCL